MTLLVPTHADRMRRGYHRASQRHRLAFVIVGAILLALAFADLISGPSGMSFSEIWTTLLAGPWGADRMNAIILWQLRMPQTIMGIVVGACLGLAGLKMQTILDNPLASPFTLGFSAAAGFGAALAIMFGGAFAIPLSITTPLLAFVMTLAACGLVYIVAMTRGASAGLLVLAGIAVMFFFQSLQALLQFLASPEVLQQIVFWLFGSLLKASWSGVAVAGGILLVCFPIAMADSWKLTVLRLGDANATSLGLSVENVRRRSFLLIALLTAAAVSFVGTIGFIGLIAPHMARALVGEDHRLTLPLSALSGAVLVVAASVIGKIISPAGALPVGIVTAIAGVPVLFALIINRSGGQKQ
ncbi:FecCD family ABC transporter permease [Rhizobium oryziradicis]|uniref:Iron-siderophore ABC transporter permease n=1 Tax=Rhizobium oryziradicis TaxID=1867956 RepID=A0A1Q8ZLF4_9HYPH|nr:iron ABC transporter permease [Rhizobium oryziradicis]OLP42737.1 iron-siderophore ABC transporter permease [Rhizobium oryziradicis]